MHYYLNITSYELKRNMAWAEINYDVGEPICYEVEIYDDNSKNQGLRKIILISDKEISIEELRFLYFFEQVGIATYRIYFCSNSH